MPEFLTPGVFVSEVGAPPPPIQEVATAVPAFVGHTETAIDGTQDLTGTAHRIASMAEFHRHFGGAPHPVFRIEKGSAKSGPSPLSEEGANLAPELPETHFAAGSETFALIQTNPAYALYGAMRLFFLNGGGPCYVISVGSYDDPFDASAMLDALAALKPAQEPALLVIPEVTRLSRAQAAQVNQAMLRHCGVDTKKRFAILDVPGGYLGSNSPSGDPIDAFRTDIGAESLDYGAAYYPWLKTSVFDARDFTFQNIEPDSRPLLTSLLSNADAALDTGPLTAPSLTGDFTIVAAPGQTVTLSPADFYARDDSSDRYLRFSVLDGGRMTGQIVKTGTDTPKTGFRQRALKKGKISFTRDADAKNPGQFELMVSDKGGLSSEKRTVFVVDDEAGATQPDIVSAITADTADQSASAHMLDADLRAASTLYRGITQAMADSANIMPPAAAMAGVYARTDNTRGVWKAPAGVSVLGVISPTVSLTNPQQEGLNISASGKSINAIRSFSGRGILVWGARTMSGSSSEFRYVPVRRFSIMVEQSLYASLGWAVFEPNDANTWASIRASVENFMTGLWRSGALPGVKPSEAYFVQVGLGETMTQQDIDRGIVNVVIGFAPLRPAEFVVIRIQQKTRTP